MPGGASYSTDGMSGGGAACFVFGVAMGYYRGKQDGLLAGRKASSKALVKNLLEDK